MGFRYHPLTYEEVTRALKKLGFYKRDHNGTAHEQWVPVDPEAPFRKVTVDQTKVPFHGDLIKWMCSQAGCSKKEFYKLAKKK